MLNNFLEVKFSKVDKLNKNVINNYSKLTLSLYFSPLLILLIIFLLLYNHDSINVVNYIQFQKKWFFLINSKLSQFPIILNNLTQFGSELIFLSFLSIFIVYAPKLWESFLSAWVISILLSRSLKILFSVPRPAAIFDNNEFIIIGEKLTGNNSLPSGHSITVFTILTVLMFAFMPQKLKYKISWFVLFIITGLMLGITRVGVGAHYPLDVVIGSVIGYISGITGIFISQKFQIWSWINNKKYYPIFISLFLIFFILLVKRISDENLIIFYFSLSLLFFSIFKIINVYVKK